MLVAKPEKMVNDLDVCSMKRKGITGGLIQNFEIVKSPTGTKAISHFEFTHTCNTREHRLKQQTILRGMLSKSRLFSNPAEPLCVGVSSVRLAAVHWKSCDKVPDLS